MKRGADVLAEADKVAKERQERDELRKAGLGFIQRFWVKKGEMRELIILDASVDSGVGLYEHNLNINGSWNNHEICVKDTHNCPLCEKFGESSSGYVIFLTGLDISGYTKKNKDGSPGEFVPHSRVLVPLKGESVAKFRELESFAKRKGRTMRGMYLRMKRGTGDQSVNIGEPSMIEELDGALYDLMDEEELVREYGHPPIVGRDGRTVIKPANTDITPVDYLKYFTFPDLAALRKRFGIAPPPGSQAQASEEWENTGGEGQPEGQQQAGGSRRQIRGVTRQQGQQQQAQQPAEQPQQQQQPPPTVRTRTRVRGVTTQRQPEPEPDDIPMNEAPSSEEDPFGGQG